MGSKRTAVPRLNLQGLGAPAAVPTGELGLRESPRRPVQQGRVQQLAAPSPPPSMSKNGKFKMAGARSHEQNSRRGSMEKEKVAQSMMTPRGTSSYKDILMTPRGGPSKSPVLMEAAETTNAHRQDQGIKPRSLTGIIPQPQNTIRLQGVLEKIEEEDKDLSKLNSKIIQVRTLGKEVVSVSKDVAQLRTAIADAEMEIQARKLQVQELLIVKQSLQATLKSLTTEQGVTLNGDGAMGKRDDVLRELKALVAEAMHIIQANHSQDDEKEEGEGNESSSGNFQFALTVIETNRTMRRLDSIRSKLETAQAIMAASASSSTGDDEDCTC